MLARDEHLRERIQVVAKQRLRAIEVGSSSRRPRRPRRRRRAAARPGAGRPRGGQERREEAAKVATKDEAKDVTAKDARAIESEAVVVRHVNGAEDARRPPTGPHRVARDAGRTGLQSR